MHTKNKKEALLQAAKELFGECGYVETTFKKISDRAGVALGLLTHHYGNKEKLFLASGLDVLEHFLARLKEATANANNGFDAVMRFCKAYLDFSIDPSSNWLVLVRCSPYSDMKTKTDRELMEAKFAEVPAILTALLESEPLKGRERVCAPALFVWFHKMFTTLSGQFQVLRVVWKPYESTSKGGPVL